VDSSRLKRRDDPIPQYSRRLVESAVFLLPDCATVRVQILIPSATTLPFRSTRNQCGNYSPILPNAFHLYRIFQLVIFVWCLFTCTRSRPDNTGIQSILPSVTTLHTRSAQDQRGNCKPILAIVHLYHILQLAVFICCSCIHIRSRPDIAGIEGIISPATSLSFRSTGNQRSNRIPSLCLAIVRLYGYCLPQPGVFVRCPATRQPYSPRI
jgi:hypothetical protein